MQGETLRAQDLMVMFLLAAVLVLGMSLVKPTLGIQLAVGFMILLIAFASIRAAIYLLIFSMLLSPEIAVGQIQGRGVGGREISLRFDDFLLIVIGFIWLVKTIVYRELALIKSTPVNRPILYYMLACVAATLLGVLAGRVKPMTGLFFVMKYFEYFFIFFMVVNNVSTKDQAVRLVVALLATSFIISLYAIHQIPSGQRATAPFEGESGEPNTLGGYLAFILAIVIGLVLHLKSARVRTLLVVLSGFISLALMATLSRSSYLAVMVMFLAVLLTQWQRPGVIIVLLLLPGLVAVVAPANVKQRVTETFSGRQYGGEVKIGGVAMDLSTSERLRSWQRVFKDWTRQPLLGYGVTGYAWTDAQYVKTLGETGLAGIVTFFFMIFRLWKRAREAFLTEQDRFCKGLAHGFLLAIVVAMVHAIGANTFIIIRIMEPFWLCAGLVMLLPTLEGKAESDAGVQVSA
ncbi:MAG: O-antigen ligase family protein [Nitrospiraceae bacterium]